MSVPRLIDNGSSSEEGTVKNKYRVTVRTKGQKIFLFGATEQAPENLKVLTPILSPRDVKPMSWSVNKSLVDHVTDQEC